MSGNMKSVMHPPLEVIYSVQLGNDHTAQRAIMSSDGATWLVGIISHQFPDNGPEIEAEFTFTQVGEIANKILEGDKEVLQTKGVARILAAYALLKLDNEGLLVLDPLPEQQRRIDDTRYRNMP